MNFKWTWNQTSCLTFACAFPHLHRRNFTPQSRAVSVKMMKTVPVDSCSRKLYNVKNTKVMKMIDDLQSLFHFGLTALLMKVFKVLTVTVFLPCCCSSEASPLQHRWYENCMNIYNSGTKAEHNFFFLYISLYCNRKRILFCPPFVFVEVLTHHFSLCLFPVPLQSTVFHFHNPPPK